MDDLISHARKVLEASYLKPIHTVCAVLETRDGQVVTALNSDHFSGFVCAETAALSQAMSLGMHEFKRIVAVRKESDGTTAVANPCGKCRQILYDYSPELIVIVDKGSEIVQMQIADLLPFAFQPQKEKIQQALREESLKEIV